MNNEQKYISYLVDLVPIIQEKKLRVENDNIGDVYINGQLQGYVNSLNFMKNLAIKNKLPVNILGLDIPIRNRINWQELQNENYKKYKKYLPQLVSFICQQITRSKHDRNDLISQGQLFAYYDILTIMKEQAELAFEIDVDEIGLKQKNIEEFVFA